MVNSKRDSPNEVDSDDGIANDIVMAVDTAKNSNVGCSFYAAQEQRLLFMTDLQNSSLHVLATLKAQIQPTVVILPFRVDAAVEAYFDPQAGKKASLDSPADSIRFPYELEYRPSSDFSYEAAKRRLLDLHLVDAAVNEKATFITPGEDEFHEGNVTSQDFGFALRQGRLLELASVIDLESRLTVGCAGAVLAYLSRRKALHQLPMDTVHQLDLQVSSIKMFAVDRTMFVNDDTLASLQILQSELSPNMHSQGPSRAGASGKEALSVYGMFHHFARTPQGRQTLRRNFSRPTLELDVIEERLDSIALLLRPEHDTILRTLAKNLGSVKNMRTVLTQLKKGINDCSHKGQTRSSVWSSVRLFAFHSLQIRDAMADLSGGSMLQIGQQVLEGVKPGVLAHIGSRVSDVVDFGASTAAHRTVVRYGVSDDLDRMKHAHDGMEDMLNKVSQEIAATIPRQRSVNLNVVFLPQIGFLISVPFRADFDLDWHVESNGVGSQWTIIFTSVGRAFYKDDHMRDLDETWGDVYASICDIEIEIVHDLAIQVLEHEVTLASISDVLGELDCLVALALGARRYKLNRPTVVSTNILQIKGGRHLLQESLVPAFVPNDTLLVGGAGTRPPPQSDEQTEAGAFSFEQAHESAAAALSGPSMCIMTGPNFSGKSIYLKQVATIVYMAHIGCYVPVDQATIGLTDAILTRVIARESVTRLQSAYMIDLQQIALAMDMVTRHSLVLIDELGRGTDSYDGAGLACGIFRNLLGRGTERPKVIVATHFHELFELGQIPRQPSLTFAHMDVKVVEESRVMDNPIVYLYSLKPGRKNSSYGIFCAAKSGIDMVIVARAQALEASSARGDDLVSVCAGISEQEADELREAEDIARDFLAQDFAIEDRLEYDI